jgi:UDP-glucuronate decarboxylase
MDRNDGRVISNFIVQALQNQDISVFGTGEQTRSFCYVDDLIDGLIKMMNTPDDVCGPINMGNPNEFTINKLANLIIKLTKSKSKIVYHPLPEDDPMRRQPHIGRAKKTLELGAYNTFRRGIITHN